MKHNSTKRTLLASLISLVLCMSMLVGSTFAWFTDTASTGVNTIHAGNLDVELEYSSDMNTWTNAQDVTTVFSDSKWEPGYTEVAYFKVTNKGTLAIDYEVTTNIVKNIPGVNKAGAPIDLSKFLKFGIVETGTKYATREQARAAITTVNDFGNISTGLKELISGESATFAMVVWMPETVGNEANHNGTEPSIQFGVQVLASQADVEKDSFGSDYDKDPTRPDKPQLDAIVATPKSATDFALILETALTGGSSNGTITINLENDFDFENNWTTINGSNYSGVNTVVINGNGHYIKNINKPLMEGVFGGDGTLTIKDLTIKDSTISAAGVYDEGIGVFINKADSSTGVTFVNCHVDNVNITNTANESTLGGFVGYSSAAALTFTNCSVTNSTFTGTKDVGAFVGYTQSAVTATDVTITGNTITSSNSSTYRVGSIAGTFNTNPSTITTKDVSNNTVTQANAADMSKKTSEYAGRIYTDVTVDGVALTKNR